MSKINNENIKGWRNQYSNHYIEKLPTVPKIHWWLCCGSLMPIYTKTLRWYSFTFTFTFTGDFESKHIWSESFIIQLYSVIGEQNVCLKHKPWTFQVKALKRLQFTRRKVNLSGQTIVNLRADSYVLLILNFAFIALKQLIPILTSLLEAVLIRANDILLSRRFFYNIIPKNQSTIINTDLSQLNASKTYLTYIRSLKCNLKTHVNTDGQLYTLINTPCNLKENSSIKYLRVKMLPVVARLISVLIKVSSFSSVLPS